MKQKLPGGAMVAVLPWREPEELCAVLAHKPGTLWLDSADGEGWSLLLAEPWDDISLGEEGSEQCFQYIFEPVDALRRGAEEALAALPDRLRPPFVGGAAGILGYELGRHLEGLLRKTPRQPGAPPLPDLWLGLYSEVLAFDHDRRRLVLLAWPWGGRDPSRRLDRWRRWIAEAPTLGAPPPAGVGARLQPERDREVGLAAIARVVDYVHAGDIFQANLSLRFDGVLGEGDDGWSCYRRLRRICRPAHGAWLCLDPDGDGALRQVASASPERLVRVRDGLCEALPIKGTRPRGATSSEDLRLARELLDSAKDRAENVMITDLLRNDLSRVCADGSVQVTELCALMTLPKVHHLVSRVTGRLRQDVGFAEILAALCPGGSITGAPKVRAMEIIAELEPRPRGPCYGSLGYLGVDGAVDLSVAIRTAWIHGRKTGFNAGGGIVADSRPADEYDEALAKAAGLSAAVLGSAEAPCDRPPAGAPSPRATP